VNRSGLFKFKIVIHKMSAFDTPLRCSASVGHQTGTGSFFSENGSVRAVFNGNTGHCSVNIPYNWVGADDTRTVSMGVSVGFDFRITTVSAAEAATPLRTTQQNPPQIPLPADGATTLTSFTFDM